MLYSTVFSVNTLPPIPRPTTLPPCTRRPRWLRRRCREDVSSTCQFPLRGTARAPPWVAPCPKQWTDSIDGLVSHHFGFWRRENRHLPPNYFSISPTPKALGHLLRGGLGGIIQKTRQRARARDGFGFSFMNAVTSDYGFGFSTKRN